MSLKIDCPVCGESTDQFDICDNCGWQNSGPGEKETDTRGPNEMSLKEAREAYKNNREIK